MLILCAVFVIDVLFLAFLAVRFPVPTSRGVIVVWERVLGTPSDDHFGYVATDGENVYIAGGFCQDKWVLDVIIAKFDAHGNQIWQRVWGYDGDDVPGGISVFNNTIFVAGCTYNSSTKNEDIFVLCMDPDGDILWVSTWDSGHNDLIINDYWSAYRSLYVCDRGIFVVGTMTSSMDSSIIVLNFNFSGRLVWYTTWKTTHDVAGRSIFIYGGKIFVLGASRGNNPHPILLVYHLNGSLIAVSYTHLTLPTTERV